MIIGVDLDDTLAESLSAFLEFYKEKYGKIMKLEDFTAYTLNEIIGMPRQDEEKLLEEFDNSDYFINLRPLQGAVESINKLKQEHKIIIITSRPGKFREKTEEWIKKNFPGIDKIIFIREEYQSVCKEKGQICKEAGVDLFIDDHINNILNCTKFGINTILINYPWNRSAEINERIKRADSWEEIMGLIEKLKK
jgi:uncharacterized HAD superfamily protein